MENMPTNPKKYCPYCAQEIKGTKVFSLGLLQTCQSCHSQIANEGPEPHQAVMGMAGGLVGSIITGGIWAAIAIIGRMEIGYAAIGVGWVAGTGVSLASGGKKGVILQVLSVLSSLLGLLFAKYFMFSHFVNEEILKETGKNLGWFAWPIIQSFPGYIPKMFGGYGLLWIILAVITAWGVASPTPIQD